MVRCVLLCWIVCYYAFSKTNTITCTFFIAGKRRPKKAGSKPQLYEDTSMQPPPSEYGAHHGQGKEMILWQGVGCSSLFLSFIWYEEILWIYTKPVSQKITVIIPACEWYHEIFFYLFFTWWYDGYGFLNSFSSLTSTCM